MSTNREAVDRTPKSSVKDAALPSGEVLSEFGVVNLNHSFPSQQFNWHPEFGPEEEHIIIPFRVVDRGYQQLKSASRAAKSLEEENGGSYKAVRLSDTRGL